MSNWIETKKECEVGGEGNLITKTVILELEKEKENLWKYRPKEAIDLILRVFGIVAIAVPIILFYKGQQAERDKQKALFQLQIYTDATVEMHVLSEKNPGSAEFEQSKNKLFYQIYPKLRLLNDKPIVDTFRVLKDIIDFSSMAYILFNNNDSLSDILYPFLMKNRIERKGAFYFKGISEKIGEIRIRTLDLTYKLNDWRNDTEFSKRFTKDYHTQLDSLNKVFFEAISTEDEAANYIYQKILTKPKDNAVWKLPEPKDDLVDNIKEIQYGFDQNVKKHMAPYISQIDSMMIRSSRLLYNQ